MDQNQRIKKAYQRYVDLISRRPSLARGTEKVRFRSIDGLTGEIEAKSRKFVIDTEEEEGGYDQGPSPGDYFLGGLAGCLAMGYLIHAARLGVPIANLQLEVEADYDLHGLYALDDTPSGYLAIRYIVHVESEADEADILRVLDESDAVDFILDSVRRPIPCERKLIFNGIAAN